MRPGIVRAINQRWLATMGLDDDSLALLAEIRERADALRRQHGPRPPWWQPFARRRWDRWMAGVQQRVLEGMMAELQQGESEASPPYRELYVERRRPWSKPMCRFVGPDAPVHRYQVGQPRCACGLTGDQRPEPTSLPGPGERQRR